MKIADKLTEILERAARPGILGAAGRSLESAARRDLELYFALLGREILKVDFARTVDFPYNADTSASFLEMGLSGILRRTSAALMFLLATSLQAAMIRADKIAVFAEARAEVSTKDPLGLSGEEAAAYAAKRAAELVTAINNTTRTTLRDIISTGIKDQLGAEGTGRLIRDAIRDMTTRRANLIASTEINDAMSEASLRKLKRLDISYKQLILSEDACPICESIASNGPVPVDEPFIDENNEEYDRTPIHPACRCATTGARPPKFREAA